MNIVNKKDYKAFYRFSELGYIDPDSESGSLKEQFNIVQKTSNDGVLYEFMISFYGLNNSINARVEVFDDAFVAFDKNAELFDELSRMKNVTPDEIEKLLISLGYIKITK